MSTGSVLLLALAVVHGQGNGRPWEIHGGQQSTNGRVSETLGGSIQDQRNRLSVDGMRAGDYHQGKVEYGRQLLTDGTRSLNGHAGLAGDNMGNRAKNFGLTYQDPKNMASFDRTLSSPLRTDTYRVERNFFTSPNGRATINGYLQHERNNFGMRNTGGGIMGRYNFRK